LMGLDDSQAGAELAQLRGGCVEPG